MRVQNWDVKLVQHARGVVGRKLEWGVTDCASLVREAARTMYGEDIFPHVGSWTTLRGAMRVWGKLDLSSVLREAGAVEISRNFVQSGDILVRGLDLHGLPQLAISLPGDIALAVAGDSEVIIVNKYLWMKDRDVKVWRLENINGR